MPLNPTELFEKPNCSVADLLLIYEAFGFTIGEEIHGYMVIFHPMHSHLMITLPATNTELHRNVIARAKEHFEILSTLDERKSEDE
jgi:hypothetical protein